MFFRSNQIVIIKGNFFKKKEGTIESSSIKQVLCIKVFLNVTALHLRKKSLENNSDDVHFSIVAASKL